MCSQPLTEFLPLASVIGSHRLLDPASGGRQSAIEWLGASCFAAVRQPTIAMQCLETQLCP